MTTREGWGATIGLFFLVQAVILALHYDDAKPIMRTMYVWLWEHVPKAEGMSETPPDRFK